MAKPVVAVLRTKPETVLEDYARLLDLAGYQDHLDRSAEVALKINISWHHFYPACSTTPWQLEGTILALQSAGLTDIVDVHNRTVVTIADLGDKYNKFGPVLLKYGIPIKYNFCPEDMTWIEYRPKARMAVLDRIFPEGIYLPDFFFGKNIVHLPTVKTHSYTVTTGAMKNAFGGLLSERRHWTHAVIHETVVDLLAIQQEIHTGLFAVMDGTFVGDGPGPRAMWVEEKDLILASADQVAIDAVSAYLQGFEPLDLDFIRLAHERGLGIGDISQIEIVGDVDPDEVRWRARTGETFASRGQKMIYHGPLKPFERMLLQSPIVPWSYAASRAYYDGFWYPFIGHKRVQEALDTKWGRLFANYGDMPAVTEPLYEPRTAAAAGLLGIAASALAHWRNTWLRWSATS